MDSIDLLIIGGGTGGCASALSACALGVKVAMTEETDWIGGQLTAQLVPPDEHPWIESFGCTATYREYREGVRRFYRKNTPLTHEARNNRQLNPGSGWVSRLCHEPRIGWLVLQQMLHRYVMTGQLTILTKRKPHSAFTNGDKIESVQVLNLESGHFELLSAPFVIDATELGDLLAMTGTEYVVGAESKADTQEPNAIDGPAEWDNVQGLTWCFALAHDEGANRIQSKPAGYDKWKAYKPSFWPGPLLGFKVLHAHTGVVKELPLYGKTPADWYALFPYRQVIDANLYKTDTKIDPATIVNWPQNDYFDATIIDVDSLPAGDSVPDGFELPGAMGPVSASRLEESKALSRSLLYWLQTEAPRHDGEGLGYPGLYTRPDLTGAEEGFAKYPYIREARRIKALYTVVEQDIAAYTNPGLTRAPSFPDSIGVGAYRIDLHPSTNGANMIDTSTLPFEIPLRSLVPVRIKNLLPACKNLGVTHITNGCYRLHPVEWNIGESVGILAAFCLRENRTPQEVADSSELTTEVQDLCLNQGIEIRWPELRPL